MNPIEIADQPRLSFVRTLLITANGVRYRLFRALVTIAVIAVAVAFLMNILSESLIKRSVAHHTQDRIGRMRLVYHWAGRLTTPAARAEILGEVSAAEPGAPTFREAAAMAELAPQDFDDFQRNARQAAAYLQFFDSIDYARRRTLVRSATGTAIFDRLAATGRLDRFEEALKVMKSVRFVSTLEEFRNFLARWPDLRGQVDKIRRGQAAATRKVAAALQHRTIFEALADAGGSFGDVIREVGFEFDPETLAPEVAEQARVVLDARMLEKSIRHELTRQTIARRNKVLPADVTMKMMWRTLRNPGSAVEYLSAAQESGIDVTGLGGPERLVHLAGNRREEAALARAERLTAGMGRGWMGLGERMVWLVIVSMLVCVIGISNAMLMTVTERFREIATMKCLGALDGFIMFMFVLEACFMGIVGGSIGAVLGAFIGLGRTALALGSGGALAVPVGELLTAGIVATCVGVVLAAIAAVYPAFRAARLAPMEAMRIE